MEDEFIDYLKKRNNTDLLDLMKLVGENTKLGELLKKLHKEKVKITSPFEG